MIKAEFSASLLQSLVHDLQKSFQYVDLLSVLETVVLLILFIYLEPVIHYWGSLMNILFKRTAFIKN